MWLVASIVWAVWIILFPRSSTSCFEARKALGLGNPFDCFDPEEIITGFTGGTMLLLLGPIVGSAFAGLIGTWIIKGFSQSQPPA